MNKLMSSILYSGNAWYIEELYEAYLEDAKSVNEDWQLYFNTLILSDPNSRRDTPHSAIQKAYYQAAHQKAHRPIINISTDATAHQTQVAVLQRGAGCEEHALVVGLGRRARNVQHHSEFERRRYRHAQGRRSRCGYL